MKVYLLRHAHTLAAAPHQPDFERELSPSGQRKLPKISKSVIEQTDSFSNLEIYCSTAKRTKQTIQSVIGDQTSVIVNYSHELYLPKLEQLLSFMNHLNTSNNILIVGHNPGLSQLASYYSGQQISLSTGDLITLEFQIENSDGFSKNTALLLD